MKKLYFVKKYRYENDYNERVKITYTIVCTDKKGKNEARLCKYCEMSINKSILDL